MASVRNRLEEVISSGDDDSSSFAAYTTFNSVGSEESNEPNRRTTDINSGSGYYQRTDSEVDDNQACLGKFKSRCCKCVDITATVTVIFLIWMVMALPLAFYIRTELGKHLPGPNFESDAGNDTCTSTVYTATRQNECTDYFRQYANCLTNNPSPGDDDIYITAPFNQTALDEATKYIRMLKTFGVRQQCRMSLEPFFCLHFTHLCYNETIRPSVKQCGHIEVVCDLEIKVIETIGINVSSYLSNCMPQSPLDNENCSVQLSNGSVYTTNYTCVNGFYRNNGSCIPECNVWSPYTNKTVLITDILAIFSAAIAVVFGIAVLFFSCLRWRKMYRYPSIFVVYQTIPTIILAVIVLVGFGARRQLFCRSRDLEKSFENPTSFCILTGIVFYYVTMLLLLLWLWHTVAVFWAVAWPLHARKFNTSSNTKYLHLIFVFASLLLPVAPTLVVLLVSSTQGTKSGFVITRAPPFVCAGHDTRVNFWAYIFPISVILAIGVTLLILMLRIVITKHFLSKIHKIRVNLNWALELKVLIVLGYYVMLGAAVLTIFTMALINLEDFYDKIVAVVICESRGIPFGSSESICTTERQDLRRTNNPYPSTIAIVILGLLPAVNLVYVVKVKEVIDKLKCCQTRRVQYVPNESSRASRYIPYKVNQEPISTTLRHGSLIVRTNPTNTESLISSQSNNDLRQ